MITAHYRNALLALGFWACLPNAAPNRGSEKSQQEEPERSQDDLVGDSACGPGAATPFERGSWHIATWNLREFPSHANSTEEVARVISERAFDFVALQELSGPNAAAGLRSNLPDYKVEIPDAMLGLNHPMGFAWNTEVLTLMDYALLSSETVNFERPPILARFCVPQHKLSVEILMLHLKAGLDDDDIQKRDLEFSAVGTWLDTRPRDAPPIMILGDLNAGPGDAFWPQLESYLLDRHFDWVSADDAPPSFIPAGITLDHIAISPALKTGLQTGTFRIHEDIESSFGSYAEVFGDHRALSVDMDFEGISEL